VDRYQVLAGLVCDAASVRFDSFSEPLGQLVAVVIAPPPPAGQGGTPGAALLAPDRAQYNQDALALARKLKDLSHPGLAAVVDSGVTGVRPFLVYERGGELTLENLVGYLGAMPMRQVLALGLEIVDALGEAARVGLAHRALLPDCIRYRGSGTICITGVGACELLHAAAPVVAVAPRPALALSAPRSAAARSGRSAASPASGVAHPDDPRLADDLQGMGGLLFLAATGSTLPLRGTDTERARAQVKLGLAQRGVPAVLSALIQRLLSPSPEARYPSWELLGGELADLVAGLGESQPWPPHSSNANPGV
jgi:serine/threonine protein kinase